MKRFSEVSLEACSFSKLVGVLIFFKVLFLLAYCYSLLYFCLLIPPLLVPIANFVQGGEEVDVKEDVTTSVPEGSKERRI